MRPRIVPVAAVAMLIAGLMVAPSTRAQDTSGLLEVLDENVVSGASRAEERATEAPAMSTTITADQLRRFGVRRLDEALNFLSLGMFAQDRLSTPEVGARGVALTRDGNNHTLIVLDGMIMNEQAGGAVYLHDVPIDAIDHVEVILGPGSVLYGSQAMFGVINVVTKRAAKGHSSAGARATFGFSPPFDASGQIVTPTIGTLGTDVTVSGNAALSLRLFDQPLELSALVDYADFRGPAFAFGKEPLPLRSDGSPSMDVGPNGTPGFWGGPVHEQWFHRTTGAFVRADYGDWGATARVAMTRLAMPQMDSFENSVGGAYDDPRNANTYGTVLVNLRYQRRLTDRLSGLGRAYFGYSSTEYERFVLTHDLPVPGVPLGIIDPQQCPIGPVGPCIKTSRFLSRWLGLEAQATYDWLGDGAYTTMLGIDGRLATNGYEFVTTDALTGKSYGSDPALTRWHGGGNLSADETSLGAYVQNVLRPWKKLTLNLGVRGDHDPGSNGGSFNALSPRAALIVKVTDQFTTKTIYSTAFRAPSFLERNEVEGRLLPNPNGLQPETVASFEQIASLRLGVNTISVGGFYSEWHNLIELVTIKAQAPIVSEYANVSNIKNYGMNLAYDTALFDRRIVLGMSLTATPAYRQLSAAQQARNPGIGDQVPVTVAPMMFGNARVAYEFHDPDDTAIAVAARFFGRQIADQAYTGGDPSNLTPRPEAPAQLELRAVVTGGIPTLRGLRYSLGVDYNFASTQPYVVGPNQGLPRYLVSTPVAAQLAPANRATALLGFEFVLDPTRGAAADAGARFSAPAAGAPKVAASRRAMPSREVE